MKRLSKIKYLLLLFSFLLLNLIAVTQKLYLSTGTKIVLNNSVQMVMMNGTVNNEGSIVPGNSSTVIFRGTDTAKILGSSTTNFNHLKIDNSVSKPLVINSSTAVYGTLTLANGTSKISTQDKLTIKSTATQTARIAAIPSGGDIAGKVTVERFVLAHRGWKLLTAPLSTTGAPTIHAAWQEGAANADDNPYPGFGTHITGNTAPNNGFDVNPQLSISCKEFVSNGWYGVANTDVQKITDQPGYFIFIRGSRANQLSLGASAASDNTVLRATGNLNIGNKVVPISGSGFTMVGNPYASPIDFGTVTKSASIINTFYVWDPLMTGLKGLGGYVTVSYNGSGYNVTSSVSTVNQYIQSGTAFFVSTTGTDGTLTFTESDKSDQSRASIPRPAGASEGLLRLDLSVVNADNSLTLYDGILIGFNDSYSNSIDQYDAVKFFNGADNISVLRAGKTFSIERRQPLDAINYDTVFLKIGSMGIKNYRLQITASDMDYPNAIGYLEDAYTGIPTLLNLTGTTIVPFSVTANAASYATNRFMIVFRKTAPLATAFTTLKAALVNQNVELDWRMGDITNITQFEIERSINGLQFEHVGTVLSNNFAGISNAFKWIDVSPAPNRYFYRIKAIENGIGYKFSKVVNIQIGSTQQDIIVQPNLIVDNTISLQLQQQPKGQYYIRLNNGTGQTLFTQSIQHGGGTRTELIQLNQPLAAGIYIVEIIQPNNNKVVLKLMKQ